jgi:hypothetical protein
VNLADKFFNRFRAHAVGKGRGDTLTSRFSRMEYIVLWRFEEAHSIAFIGPSNGSAVPEYFGGLRVSAAQGETSRRLRKA